VIREGDVSEERPAAKFLSREEVRILCQRVCDDQGQPGRNATQVYAETAFQRLSRTNSRRDFQAAGPTHRKPDNALITATGDFALAECWEVLFRWRDGECKQVVCAPQMGWMVV
jgi:hypothetical protein